MLRELHKIYFLNLSSLILEGQYIVFTALCTLTLVNQRKYFQNAENTCVNGMCKRAFNHFPDAVVICVQSWGITEHFCTFTLFRELASAPSSSTCNQLLLRQTKKVIRPIRRKCQPNCLCLFTRARKCKNYFFSKK